MPHTPGEIGQPIIVGEDAPHMVMLLDAIYGGLQVESIILAFMLC
jgi:hypothetical protein